jgi:hypothetical protein
VAVARDLSSLKKPQTVLEAARRPRWRHDKANRYRTRRRKKSPGSIMPLELRAAFRWLIELGPSYNTRTTYWRLIESAAWGILIL